MNIREYQLQVTRTFPDLGSRILNSLHCTAGMGSELLEEVTIALDTGDKINLAEELADAQWYACNYATLYGLVLPDKIHALHPNDTSLEDAKLYINNRSIMLGKLLDFDKKELAYKKLTDNEKRQKVLHQWIASLEFMALLYGIDMETARDRVIQKLYVRYPAEEGYSDQRAVNRDLQTERETLEGKAA